MEKDPADLSNLHDIVLPPDVSWWPPAPGWIALLIIAIIVASYYAYRTFRSWRENAYRREAIRQLATADSSVQVAEILRRTALAVAPREEIAGLQGDAWTQWLSERSNLEPSDVVREALGRTIYHPSPSDSDLPALKDFAHTWISHHTRPC
ncbi:DUF4381 domain-containing protein [Haloferula chungangensis]|uniref:DUF4381 domain-containing protein n=1 Tax=Haloferula chungangensis TaxID=1048331 RepID=A0ABW2LC90_9BACT